MPEPSGNAQGDNAAGSSMTAAQSQKAEGAAPPRITPPAGERTETTVREPEIQSQPAKPPAAVHDISLELNRGDQRVAVRIMERGGDVQVAVRTPDPRLAGDMRQDLPGLASRLEQAGFRADNWHGTTSASTPDRHNLAETSGTPEQKSGTQGNPDGRERQNDAQQNRQKEAQARARTDRKQFAGLFSSMR